MERAGFVRSQDAPPPKADDRRFTAALTFALLAHLAIFIGGYYSPPVRHMGEESGSADGLTVEIVDPSELAATASPPPSPTLEAAPPAQPEPTMESQREAQPEQASPPPLAQSEAEATPAPEAPTAPPEPAPKQKAPAKQPDSKALTLDEMDPSLFKLNTPSSAEDTATAETKPHSPQSAKEKSAEHSTKPPSKPAKPANQQLSLAMPTPSFETPIDVQGRRAAVSRPEGITRSGLNDEFGRGVIRALRQTMPPPNGRLAEVSVRFVLTVNGNLEDVQLVRSSGDSILDRNIIFAVKQANFPIPPTNLTAIDRQFRVTYIYR